MKKIILAAATIGLFATPAVAQVNQGQGGAPSAQSGGTVENPRTRIDKGANSASQPGSVSPARTTGSSHAPAGNYPAPGNSGKSGGEGGSGR